MYKLLRKFLVDETIPFEKNLAMLKRYRGFSGIDMTISSYEELLRIFYKDSIENFPVEHFRRNNRINKWCKSFASNRIKGDYVSPKNLEPFIARYIIAINQIGIKTYYSCDGWHEKSQNYAVIGFKDRNSMIWHKIVSLYAKDGMELAWNYNYPYAVISLPKNDEGKIEIYNRINKRAEYFEEQKEIFLRMKIDIINQVKGKPKNMFSDEELERFLLNQIKNRKKNNTNDFIKEGY